MNIEGGRSLADRYDAPWRSLKRNLAITKLLLALNIVLLLAILIALPC